MIGETLIIVRRATQQFRRSWRDLLATDLFYRVVAVSLLSPVVAVALRAFVSLSGSPVLSDQDILYFVLSPIGLVALVVLASAQVTILALQQACLMGVAFSAMRSSRLRAVEALRWAGSRTGSILRVSARLVVRVLVLVFPFLGAGGLVVFLLLSEFDINYYLLEKPPAFWTAAAATGVLLVVMSILLVRRLIGWVYALPMVLMEKANSSTALAASEERARGHRLIIASVIGIWALLSLGLSALALGAVRGVGLWVLPRFQSSLSLLLIFLGGVVLLAILVSLAVSAVSSSFFAALVVTLYERLGGGASLGVAPSAAEVSARATWGLTRKGAGIGLLGAAALSALVGWLLLRTFRVEDDVVVIAHRGAAGRAPENTLAAVERAIADGTDWVEIDVQETADGEVVVLHDSDFMKIASSPLKIWAVTYDEVRKLDAGSWFGPEFRGERIPKLQEVLERARDRARVVIELKYYGHDERLEERVVEIVESTGMAGQIAVMSLSQSGVEKVRALRPNWRVGILAATAVGRLARTDTDFLAVSLRMASPSFVRQAHRAGKDVYVWTVNDAVTMSQMVTWGVDGLITDEPRLAREVLTLRAQMSSTERLLLATASWFGVKAAKFDESRDTD